MDVIGVKVLAGFLLFVLAVVCGWTPYWCITCFRRRGTAGLQRSDTRHICFVQCLHAMSSGVLIATCLLHLLPESLEAVREAMSAKYNQNVIQLESSKTSSNNNPVGLQGTVDHHFDEDHYPFGEFLVALGFMCVFMVDSGIKSWSESKNRASNIVHDHNDDDAVFLWTDEIDSSQNKGVQRTGASNKESRPTNGQWLEWLRARLSKFQIPYGPIQQREKEVDPENMLLETVVPDYNNIDHGLPTTGSGGTVDVTAALSHPSLLELRPQASPQERQECSKSNHLRSVALVAALCIHGFFDGLMVGLQTSMSVILSLVFAISLHKSFVAVGLSLNLLSRNRNFSVIRIVFLVIMFAAASPIGVLVSSVFLHGTMGVTSSEQTNIVSGCLQSFAVGTFMYVTFTETTERQHQRVLSADITSHVFLLFGFGVMAGLRAAVGDSWK